MKQPGDISGRGRLFLAVAGQVLGLLLAAGLLWLQSGGDFLLLADRYDHVFGVALMSWPVALGLVVWASVRHAVARPVVPLLWGLVPLVLGFVLAAMTTANLGFLEGASGRCDVWLAVGFSAERLRVVGLVASGTIWLGCLPVLLALHADRGPARPRWALPAVGALVAAAAVWALFDPLVPATGQVGGPAVRGFWVVALAVPVLWAWAQGLGRRDEQGLALGLAAWAGLFSAAAGLWLLHRADGLYRLSDPGEAGVFYPEWFGAGLVLSAALPRLLPAGLLALATSFWCTARRAGRPALRRALALVGALAVLSVLAAAHESGFSRGFEQQCASGARDGPGCAGSLRVLGFCLKIPFETP